MTTIGTGPVRWIRLSDCGAGKTCPRVGRTDRGTVLVQGYPIDDVEAERLGVPPGEFVVEVPESLLPEV